MTFKAGDLVVPHEDSWWAMRGYRIGIVVFIQNNLAVHWLVMNCRRLVGDKGIRLARLEQTK